MKEWQNELDERQRKEIAFARLYAADYAHGTDGHNRLLLINKLAALLDSGYGQPVAVKLPERDPNKPFINLRKPAAIRD